MPTYPRPRIANQIDPLASLSPFRYRFAIARARVAIGVFRPLIANGVQAGTNFGLRRPDRKAGYIFMSDPKHRLAYLYRGVLLSQSVFTGADLIWITNLENTRACHAGFAIRPRSFCQDCSAVK